MKQDPLGVTYADYDRGAPRRGGNAAAIVAKHRLTSRQIDVAELQTRLRVQRVAISV